MTYKTMVLRKLKKSVNRRKAKTFTGYEIKENGWGGLRYSNTMRALRQLKSDGIIDYECTSPTASQYRLISIND